MYRRLLIVLVVLVTSLPSVVSAGQDVTGSGSFDLPASLLRPDDLEASGLDGFGTGVGATGGGDSLERFDQTYRGSDDGAATLEPDDVERSSSLYLIRGADLDLPSPDRVLTAISQFPDEEAATDAFEDVAERRDEIADEPGAEVEVDDGQGLAFLVSEADPLGAGTYRQASVLAVVDDLVIEVAVELTSDTPLTMDLAEGLIATQLERLNEAEPDAEALGNRLLEITGPSVAPDLSRYLALDGSAIPIVGEAEGARDDRIALYDAYETIDAFQTSVVLADARVAVTSFLSRHATDTDARSYFQAVPDLLTSNEDYMDVELGNTIVPVGDAATLVTYEIDGQDGVVVTELVFRTGTVVVELIVNASEAMGRSEIMELARATEACLDGDDCVLLSIPDDLDLTDF